MKDDSDTYCTSICQLPTVIPLREIFHQHPKQTLLTRFVQQEIPELHTSSYFFFWVVFDLSAAKLCFLLTIPRDLLPRLNRFERELIYQRTPIPR